MGAEAPDAKPEIPVEAPATAETAEAKAEREAAESAKLEAGAKALADVKDAEAQDKAEAENPEQEMQEALEALEITTDPNDITIIPDTESKAQEAKSEGGFFNTLSGGLASAMEPLVSNMLARTADRLKKNGTGDWKDSLSDTLLKGLVQLSLFFNPKAPWAEKLFADEETKDLFEKGVGMTLAKDADGNYSCTFEAVLQPEALPCFPANELLSRYLGEDTLPEFKRGQSIKDLKDGLAGIPTDSSEKAMADLMLKNINELGVKEEATLSAAFKSGFGRNLEARLALLTDEGEKNLVTSSLVRHETETQSTEVPAEENALEALNLGEEITLETPLTPDLLTKLSDVDATGNADVQKVKTLAGLLTTEGATAKDAAGKDMDLVSLKKGSLKDLLLAAQNLA